MLAGFQIIKVVGAVGFILLTLFTCLLILQQIRLSSLRAGWESSRIKKLKMQTTTMLTLWLVSVAVLSVSGFTLSPKWYPLNIALIVIPPLLFAFSAAISPVSGSLLKHIPLIGLTYIQSLRVIAEILLWMLFLNQLLPAHMTFEGKNYNIFAGISAPFVALTLVRYKIFMILWNIFGLAVLLNVFLTAILSVSTPIQVFFTEPDTSVLLRFPFILLPAFLIPFALFVHLLSLRKLFKNKYQEE